MILYVSFFDVRRWVSDVRASQEAATPAKPPLPGVVWPTFGLDNRRLHYPGRKRLDIDDGRVIDDVLA